MVLGKILFDAAGVAALAYMTWGPAAEVLDRAPPAEASAAVAIADAAADARPIRRADDGLFYVWCDVNGTPVRFLVDTGASVVVLTPEDARRAGVTAGAGHGGGRLQTASGSARMRWARIDSVTVAGQEHRDLDAAVMSGGLHVSLLGQNLLTRMNAVAIDGNQLHLR